MTGREVMVTYQGRTFRVSGVVADIVMALTAARQNFAESSPYGWSLELHIGQDKIDMYEREKVVSVKRER